MFEVLSFEARTLSWWFDQKENIDLDPLYQRRGQLWSESDKQFLIDSILNGYDVPKIYIADFTFGMTKLNSSGCQYAVIDGKQRLGSIFDFFEGKLTLATDFEWSTNPSLRLGGLSYMDLLKNHPKAASKFNNFNLAVMRVITDDEAKINELFVRLNRSKSLTGAEIRNAMRGVVPGLIRSLTAHTFFSDRIAFSVQRRQDQNAAAKFLLVEFRGKPVGTTKPGIDKFVTEGFNAEALSADAKASEFERAAKRVERVLDRMSDIFVSHDPLLKSAGPLVVYYWLIRESKPTTDKRMRAFLLAFNEQRAANKRIAGTNAEEYEGVDPVLVSYDQYERSTDNQGSIEGRVDILRRRLEKFR